MSSSRLRGAKSRIHPLPPPPREQLAHLKAIADGNTIQERPCRLTLYRHRAARSTPDTEIVHDLTVFRRLFGR